MAEIIEIPLDNPESSEDIAELPAEISEIAQPASEETPGPKKARAKGRPKGALNKQPSKPRVKRVVIEEPVTAEADEPPSPRRNLPIPEFGVNDVAVEMLRLLSNQQQVRQQRKRALYESWFR